MLAVKSLGTTGLVHCRTTDSAPINARLRIVGSQRVLQRHAGRHAHVRREQGVYVRSARHVARRDTQRDTRRHEEHHVRGVR